MQDNDCNVKKVKEGIGWWEKKKKKDAMANLQLEGTCNFELLAIQPRKVCLAL